MEKPEKSTNRHLRSTPTIESSGKSEKPKNKKLSKVGVPKSKYPDNNDKIPSNISNKQPVPIAPMQPDLYPIPEQPMHYQQPYGQPVSGLPMQGNVYMINQLTPNKAFVPLKFGYNSLQIICPYCHQSVSTRIEESFNCCTCLTYLFIIILIPILLVLAVYAGCGAASCGNSSCDCNCCDSTCCICGAYACNCCRDYNHYCSNCGQRLGSKDSFHELCPCFSSCIC